MINQFTQLRILRAKMEVISVLELQVSAGKRELVLLTDMAISEPDGEHIDIGNMADFYRQVTEGNVLYENSGFFKRYDVLCMMDIVRTGVAAAAKLEQMGAEITKADFQRIFDFCYSI